MPSRFRPEQGDPDRFINELRLAALPSAAHTARRLVVSELTRWGLDDLIDPCSLVVSELITNAIAETGSLVTPVGYAALHAVTPATIVFRFRLTHTHVIAEVWDRSAEFPAVKEAGTTDEGGRGLVLVDAFTSKWGFYGADMGGKVVWGCWVLPGVPR